MEIQALSDRVDGLRDETSHNEQQPKHSELTSEPGRLTRDMTLELRILGLLSID